MHFLGVIYEEILYSTHFSTHCLSILMREFWSVQAWRSSRKLINARVRGAVRALVWRFKWKRTWRSWHHDLESIRHDLESLCSDNDPRCHMRKIKIISSDWIALLRRLLITFKLHCTHWMKGKITIKFLVTIFLFKICHCKCFFWHFVPDLWSRTIWSWTTMT